MDNQVNFKAAANSIDPAIRQAYLDSIMPQMPPSIERLIYDGDGRDVGRHIDNLYAMRHYTLQRALELRQHITESFNTIYFIIPAPLSLIGSGKKQPVFCLPQSFIAELDEDCFLNTLIDHEGTHANHMANGIVLPNGMLVNSDNVYNFDESLLEAVSELEAYSNHLNGFHKRNIGWSAARDALVKKIEYYSEQVKTYFP